MLNTCKYTFNHPIIATFQKREKRFFSYFKDSKEQQLIAHCVNTGKMSDILIPGSLSLLSTKNTGKLLYTWEAVQIHQTWIGTNTSVPNKLVAQLIDQNILFHLNKEIFKNEVTFKFPEKTYRADFASTQTVIEVKHVHWRQGDIAYFPDCITERSSEQMDILIKLKEMGKRVIIIYIVQRNDLCKLSVDSKIDKRYYEQVLRGQRANLEFIAFNCLVDQAGICLNEKIEVLL